MTPRDVLRRINWPVFAFIGFQQGLTIGVSFLIAVNVGIHWVFPLVHAVLLSMAVSVGLAVCGYNAWRPLP